MEQLQDDIFIGTLKDGGDTGEILANGITAIHKLTHKVPSDPYPEDVTVYPTVLIDRNISRYDHFKKAVLGLVHSLQRDETVLVHCSAGVSRTPIVTATAVALVEDRTIDDVLDDIETTMLSDGFDVARRGDDDRPTDIHPRLQEFAKKMVREKNMIDTDNVTAPVNR